MVQRGRRRSRCLRRTRPLPAGRRGGGHDVGPQPFIGEVPATVWRVDEPARSLGAGEDLLRGLSHLNRVVGTGRELHQDWIAPADAPMPARFVTAVLPLLAVRHLLRLGDLGRNPASERKVPPSVPPGSGDSYRRWPRAVCRAIRPETNSLPGCRVGGRPQLGVDAIAPGTARAGCHRPSRPSAVCAGVEAIFRVSGSWYRSPSGGHAEAF